MRDAREVADGLSGGLRAFVVGVDDGFWPGVSFRRAMLSDGLVVVVGHELMCWSALGLEVRRAIQDSSHARCGAPSRLTAALASPDQEG